MKRNITVLLTLLSLSLFSAIPSYATVTILNDIPYAEGNRIKANIKQECVNLGSKLAKFTQKFGKKYQVDVTLADAIDTSGPGKVLQLEITDAVSRGNAFIGHSKFVDIEGTLWENGKKVASFTATRVSGGGAFGGYKGSCSVLGRCVKALGKDVARWLKDPVDNTHLGD